MDLFRFLSCLSLLKQRAPGGALQSQPYVWPPEYRALALTAVVGQWQSQRLALLPSATPHGEVKSLLLILRKDSWSLSTKLLVLGAGGA